MLKPKAVSFRISLWKLYNNLSNIYNIPTFGLNFIVNQNLDKKFLLLCGFENFREFFVRIDILEKLFIKILSKTKNKKFKIDSDMMNLLGCSKDDFYKLMSNMNYKKEKEIDTYMFIGELKEKRSYYKRPINENPFSKLLNLNLK